MGAQHTFWSRVRQAKFLRNRGVWGVWVCWGKPGYRLLRTIQVLLLCKMTVLLLESGTTTYICTYEWSSLLLFNIVTYVYAMIKARDFTRHFLIGSVLSRFLSQIKYILIDRTSSQDPSRVTSNQWIANIYCLSEAIKRYIIWKNIQIMGDL